MIAALPAEILYKALIPLLNTWSILALAGCSKRLWKICQEGYDFPKVECNIRKRHHWRLFKNFLRQKSKTVKQIHLKIATVGLPYQIPHCPRVSVLGLTFYDYRTQRQAINLDKFLPPLYLSLPAVVSLDISVSQRQRTYQGSPNAVLYPSPWTLSELRLKFGHHDLEAESWKALLANTVDLKKMSLVGGAIQHRDLFMNRYENTIQELELEWVVTKVGYRLNVMYLSLIHI